MESAGIDRYMIKFQDYIQDYNNNFKIITKYLKLKKFLIKKKLNRLKKLKGLS